MSRIGMMAGLLAACATSPALACSMENWNIYADFREPSLVGLVDRASTIDWIVVEAGPVRCPYPQRRQEQPDQPIDTAAECSDDWRRGDGNFGGRVVERLKGASPDRFALAILHVPDPAYGEADPGQWRGFSDPRELPLQYEAETARWAGERAARHNGTEFWDQGALQFQTDMSDSCGGGPTLDPGMRYLAFRDARGSVIALEPVSADDDLLLVRLRARRVDAAAPMVQDHPVEAFFKAATGLVLVRVQSCRGGGASRESEKATLVSERGSPAFVMESQWSVSSDRGTTYQHAAPGSNHFEFDDLWDHFAARGERCPRRGEHVLLLRPSFGARDGSDYGVDRPIRVGADRTIKLSDIPTALRLNGPDRITVEQAFQWFEEGRAAATPAPSSS